MPERRAGDPQGEYSSPPCFMHELDPTCLGSSGAADPQQHADVMRWRKAERERQLQLRLALNPAERRRVSEMIARGLDLLLGEVNGRTISVYWPFRGEPDLRPWVESVWSRGGICALPVVVQRRAPLVFRTWEPGASLEPGIWNIPIPANGSEVLPEIVIAPVVAFDTACFRLGYGGGFFDRTLATMPNRPTVIGVGHSGAAIPTIYPQPHDIAMDLIVTERGVFERAISAPT